MSTLARVHYIINPNYDDYVATNAESRRIAAECIKNSR